MIYVMPVMGSRIPSRLGPTENMLLPSREERELARFRRRKDRRVVPLSDASMELKRERARYRTLRRWFLAQPENQWCECCRIRRDKLGEDIPLRLATEIHHWAGRIGRLLNYVKFWKPSCWWCREWPHQNKAVARRLGLLAPASQWEVMPEE